MTDETDDADHAPGPTDDREAMDRITAEMAELLRRMAEFQKEMEPFLPLLAEPDEPPADESDQES